MDRPGVVFHLQGVSAVRKGNGLCPVGTELVRKSDSLRPGSLRNGRLGLEFFFSCYLVDACNKSVSGARKALAVRGVAARLSLKRRKADFRRLSPQLAS